MLRQLFVRMASSIGITDARCSPAMFAFTHGCQFLWESVVCQAIRYVPVNVRCRIGVLKSYGLNSWQGPSDTANARLLSGFDPTSKRLKNAALTLASLWYAKPFNKTS